METTFDKKRCTMAYETLEYRPRQHSTHPVMPAALAVIWPATGFIVRSSIHPPASSTIALFV
jgi:hypothetical protein